MARTLPPASVASRAVSASSFSEMSAATTDAPAPAKASTMARPMPPAAPVTMATLPSNDSLMP